MHQAYGIVDANRAFVSDLLTKLSGALALPSPVREAFLFDASPAFYTACTESVVTLQRATRKIIEHLGLACGTVVVGFTKLPVAGRIERSGTDWFVEIDSAHRGDGRTIGAIIAHECCHILVHDRRVRPFGNALDEVHVDLAAMLAGLGPLTLNAIHDEQRHGDNVIQYEHKSFGYLRAHMLEHAYGDVCARMGMPIRTALAPLSRPIVRRGVRYTMLRGKLVRPPKLAFAPADAHAIAPCPSLLCTARLRVPTQRRGTARCPTCKASVELSGAPLITRAASSPEPLEPRTIPKFKPPSAAYVKMRAIGPGPRIVTALLVLAAIAWIAIAMFGNTPHHESTPRHGVGEFCITDYECESGRCMHVQSRYGSGEEYTGRYCTQICENDGDCPPAMRCGEVQQVDTVTTTAHACVRP